MYDELTRGDVQKMQEEIDFHAVSALPCHTGWSYAPNIIS